DAPHHRAAPLGQVVLGLAVVEERVLGAREEVGHIHAQRGDPDGVAPVQDVRESDEALEVGRGADRADLERAQPITPSWRPIVAKASSAKSICSAVCVAIRLVRRRHCEGGTAGGTTGLVNTPASNSLRQKTKVLSIGPTSTGTMGVSVGPMS